MPKTKDATKTPGRRLNGEGSFSQRADGTWKCMLSLGDGMGNAVRKSVYGKTLPECKSKAEALKKRCDGQSFADVRKSGTTVGELADEYLKELTERVSNGSLKQNSYARYEMFIRVHIKPRLGEVKVKKLTPANIDNFHKALNRSDLSPHTVRDISSVLGLLLKRAYQDNLIPVNPMDKCKRQILPGKQSSEIRVMDNKEISAFLSACVGHPLENLFQFALFEGLRIGELLGLSWDCWDSERMTLRIYRQLQYDRNKKAYGLESLKTKQSRRILSLPASMNAVLEKERKRQLEQRMKAGELWSNPDDLIFANEYGGHLCHNSVRKQIKKIFAEIGVPEAHFHSLRHAFTALCIENGDSAKAVQTALGHSCLSTTMNIYAYILSDEKRASADRMEGTIQRYAAQMR